MAMAVCTGFTSCEKDDGSEGIELRMRNETNGNSVITLLYVDSAVYLPIDQHGRPGDYYLSSSIELSISVSNNFRVRGTDYSGACNYDISCVGNVKNIKRIKKIPESGWVKEISVRPGNGYIIRNKNLDGDYKKYCRYAKVYVEDWIEDTSGGIIGATIRYQDNWKIED